MTDQEFNNLLTSIKNAPEAGGEFDVQEGWRKFAVRYGFDPDPKPAKYTLGDYLQFASYQFQHAVLRPASLALSVFVVVFGGWVATVNASFDSVPGDILYPVKLATERMQLTFAGSSQQRARLHTEFAGRRLDEMVEISNSDRSDKEGLVIAAVESFKAELASANNELTSAQNASPDAAADIAMVLDRKTEEFESVIAQSEPVVPEGSQETVAQALVVVEETNAQAIDSLVQTHETSQTTQTGEHLQQSFQQTYDSLKDRIALNLGRLSVIGTVLESVSLPGNDYALRIEEARLALIGHDRALSDAQDSLAAGGFRRAFELLEGVETEVASSEAIIVQLEIDISTAIALSQPITEPAVPSMETSF